MKLTFDAGDPTVAVPATSTPPTLNAWTTLIALRMADGWPAYISEFSVGGDSTNPNHGGGQARVLIATQAATRVGGTQINIVDHMAHGPRTFSAVNYPQFVFADCVTLPTMTVIAANISTIFPRFVVPPQVVPMIRSPQFGEVWPVPRYLGGAGYWILLEARFVEAQKVVATLTLDV